MPWELCFFWQLRKGKSSKENEKSVASATLFDFYVFASLIIIPVGKTLAKNL